MRRAARLAAVLGAVTLVVSLVGPAVAEEKPPAPVKLEWGACPVDVTAASPLLQCTTVPVPLDYDNPDKERIDIAISRLAATDTGNRRGVLMTNPGGPGSSGLTLPADLFAEGLPVSVTATYDVIGMDPRGVGRSAPVSCGFTLESGYSGNVPPYAVDAASVQTHAALVEEVAADCERHDTEGQMRHISTANTARDLNQVRLALGEEQVSYLGYSYGTALGAAFASMFPEHTDRVVLDSNVGGTRIDHAAQRRYGQGFEEAFVDFARWAAQRDDSYGLGDSPAQVRRTYLQLTAQLDKDPVNGFTGSLLRFLTFGGLYRETGYASTAQLWQSLSAGGPAAMKPMAPTSPVPSGPAPTDPRSTPPADDASPTPELAPWDNSWSAYLAVTCNDGPWSEDVTAYQQAVKQDRKRYPLYGPAAANINPCAFWAWEPSEDPVAVVDEGEANVLLLQNRRDPATPLAAAKTLRKNFQQRASLITVDGSGHGVYLYGGNACALNLTTRFLLGSDLPTDTRCRKTP